MKINIVEKVNLKKSGMSATKLKILDKIAKITNIQMEKQAQHLEMDKDVNIMKYGRQIAHVIIYKGPFFQISKNVKT